MSDPPELAVTVEEPSALIVTVEPTPDFRVAPPVTPSMTVPSALIFALKLVPSARVIATVVEASRFMLISVPCGRDISLSRLPLESLISLSTPPDALSEMLFWLGLSPRGVMIKTPSVELSTAVPLGTLTVAAPTDCSTVSITVITVEA